jgi:hypothetical protein
MEQVLGNAPYRRSEDDHAERGADKTIGNDDQRHRRARHQIQRLRQTQQRCEELVQQAHIRGVDHPQPQQNVEDGRAHARQQPDTAKKAARYLVERGRGERQHEPKCDIEGGKGSEGVDKSKPDNLRQAPVALEDFLILLGGEFADAQRPVEVGERHRDIDQHRDHKRKETSAQSRDPETTRNWSAAAPLARLDGGARPADQSLRTLQRAPPSPSRKRGFRHCERSEAISGGGRSPGLDCFVACGSS